MASSNRLIYTCITYGNRTQITTAFNEQTSINELDDHVRTLFGGSLPIAYYFKFYNTETAEFIDLDQNVLECGCNPFEFYSTINGPHIGSVFNPVKIFVTQAPWIGFENNTQISITPQDTISLGHNYSLQSQMNEQECQQDTPSYGSTTTDNISQSEDLSNALLSEKRSEVDEFMDLLLATNNDESSVTYSVENQSGLMSIVKRLISNEIDVDIVAESNPLPIEGLPVENRVTNDNSLQQIEAGDAMPPQIDVPTARDGTQIAELNRLAFSLDVGPYQKKIYRSDRFNQKDSRKTNGYVTRIQGIKTPAQKSCSVWPKIHIIRYYRNRPNTKVVVYALLEKQQNGLRSWYIHRDKGFLPKDFKHDTPPTNPIKIGFNENDLTDGDLKLDLRMTTMWDKSKITNEVELCHLDEQSTVSIHPAKHDASSPRLLCVIEENDVEEWTTACLSDFIRIPK